MYRFILKAFIFREFFFSFNYKYNRIQKKILSEEHIKSSYLSGKLYNESEKFFSSRLLWELITEADKRFYCSLILKLL